MEKRIVKTYTEVELPESSFDRSYKNPLTKAFQQEYALYESLTKLFERVECRSMCIETFRMYFRELPLKGGEEQEPGPGQEAPKKAPRVSREKLLDSMSELVERDVLGNITFPQMSRCAVEVSTLQKEDGTHWLVFDDGIYGFAVSLKLDRKGKAEGIEVRDFGKPGGSDNSSVSARDKKAEKCGRIDVEKKGKGPRNAA